MVKKVKFWVCNKLPHCFPKWWYYFMFPLYYQCMSIPVPPCPHQLLVLSVCSFGHCSRYVVVFHCAFNLNFPNDSWCWASSLCLFAILMFSLVRPLIKSFAHVIISFFLITEFWVYFIYSAHKSLIRYDLKISSFSLHFLFIFLMVLLKSRLLIFHQLQFIDLLFYGF